ncbi:MAG: hypothetical protein EXS12_06275 [Phycisphaerales bacterium]|nr:hypothetical protein [Phycisphaerales bacterium]
MAVILGSITLGCFSANANAQTTNPAQSPGGTSAAPKGGGAKADPNNELMNEGDEVDGNITGATKSGAQNKKTKDATAAGKNSPPAENQNTTTGEQKPEWSVLLMTFTEQGHAAAANATREAIVKRYPTLATARVCALDKGSAIVYGSFVGLEDVNAKPAIAIVKAIEEKGARPFARAYLVRLQTTSNQVKLGPYDLSKVRARFPNVVPLFTVKVATWSDFQSGEIPFNELQKKAEGYCAELRLQGFEAYVKHDADDRSSTVTIGVFDSSAYDARSTLFHPDVEKIMKKFPVLLVNGEPLFMPPPRGLTNAKPSAKPCILIEVPR